MTLLQAIADALRRAADYNRGDQVPPAAVLWTDGARQWEALVPALRGELPILTLGPYEPASRSGPAIWIRAVLSGALLEADWPSDETPVVYLPGVSRQELRATESCPAPLQPLAELQYRGA